MGRRWMGRGVLLGILFGMWLLPLAAEEPVRVLFRRAEGLWKERKWTEARPLYEEVARRDESLDGIRARERLVRILSLAKDVPGELQLLSELIRLRPDPWSLDGFRRRGDLFYLHEDYEHAAKEYRVALQEAGRQGVVRSPSWRPIVVKFFVCLDVVLLWSDGEGERQEAARELVEASVLVPGIRRAGLVARDRFLAGEEEVWRDLEEKGDPRWGPELRYLHTLGWMDVPAYAGRQWVVPRAFQQALDRRAAGDRQAAIAGFRAFLNKPDFSPMEFLDPAKKLNQMGGEYNGKTFRIPPSRVMLSSTHPIRVMERHSCQTLLWAARFHLGELLVAEGKPLEGARELARFWNETRRERSLLVMIMPLVRNARAARSALVEHSATGRNRAVRDLVDFYGPRRSHSPLQAEKED